MLAHVDLCSGIGGFALGFQWAGLSRPVLFCDIEEWSRKVLAKHWPDVPIAHDVKELASDPRRLVPDCDILSCGYPCQPFSQAGVRRGTEDDRHIWPEIFAIIKAKRPRWVVCENVAGHISLGLDQVLSDLADKAGYEVQTFCVGAVAVDAPHRRQRVWIIASHADSESQSDGTINARSGRGKLGQAASDDTDADSQRSHRAEQHQQRGGKSADRQERELGSICEVLAGRGDAAERSASDVGDTNSQQRRTTEKHGELDLDWAVLGQRQGPKKANAPQRSGTDVADAESQRVERHRTTGEQEPQSSTGERLSGRDSAGSGASNRIVESSMGGVADGLSTWLDEPRGIPRVATGVKQRAARLKGLGNAILPQIAMQIGLTIKAVENG